MADGAERVQLAVKGDFRSAFQSRDFRLYQAARLMVILGAEAQSVAVAWQVYALTHSALDLGYTGLALFLPGLFVPGLEEKPAFVFVYRRLEDEYARDVGRFERHPFIVYCIDRCSISDSRRK